MLIFRCFCPIWSGIDAYGGMPLFLSPGTSPREKVYSIANLFSALQSRAGGAAGGPGGLPPLLMLRFCFSFLEKDACLF
jgi:hypothetical protein